MAVHAVPADRFAVACVVALNVRSPGLTQPPGAKQHIEKTLAVCLGHRRWIPMSAQREEPFHEQQRRPQA